ncbi:MAG: PKD domain-containing protein, partial [Bacteroidetes bacterium]|nr:PKD domain-containing protein [Bacteroidota bacterium]
MKKSFTHSIKKNLFFLFLLCAFSSLNAQTASFTLNSINQCFVGNNYVFTNTSTPGVISYHWDFGDGSTSTLASPTHVYSSPGYHYVNLNATYSN